MRLRKHILLALLALVAAWAAWTFRDRFAFTTGQPDETLRTARAPGVPQVYYGPAFSIAVLPFDCVRGRQPEPPPPGGEVAAEPDTSPALAFGLAQAVIDRLLPIRELQVTADTSSFFFAGSSEPLEVLAERLKVRHLLDGCVTLKNGLLGVETRLFDVRAGEMDWTHEFTSPVEDVFEIMDRLTAEAAEAVRTGSAADVVSLPDPGPEAWLMLIEADHFYRQRDPENLVRAEQAYRQVVDDDPGVAAGWLGLARVYLEPSWPQSAEQPGFERSRQAVIRVLELDPEQPEAHLILSRINRIYDWNFRRAREEASLAMVSLEGDAEILANASRNEFIFGHFGRSISLLEKAVARNPVALNNLLRLGLAHEFAGNPDQALIAYKTLLGLNPDYPAVHAYRARIKLAQDKAGSALQEAEQEPDPFWKRYALILALDALDRPEESDPLLQAMIDEDSQDAAFQLAEIHARRGDPELAFEWLYRALEQKDGGMSEILGNPFFSGLHDDDRWLELITALGLSP